MELGVAPPPKGPPPEGGSKRKRREEKEEKADCQEVRGREKNLLIEKKRNKSC